MMNKYLILGLVLAMILSGCVEEKPPLTSSTEIQFETKTTIADSNIEELIHECDFEKDNPGKYVSCLLRIAVKQDNPLICDKIQDLGVEGTGDIVNTCYASTKNVLSYCENIDSSLYNNKCYYTLAIKRGNTSLCEKIIDEKLNGLVKDYCYMDVAEEIKNKSICEKIQGIERRETCYVLIVESTGELSLCEKITAINKKDRCFEAAAIVTGNHSLCEKIGDMDDIPHCYSRTAKAIVDYTICEKIQNRYHREELCLLEIAEETNDESICYKIEGLETRNKCFFFLASHKKDATLCYEIINSTCPVFSKINCYEDIAIETNNSLICDYILNQTEKESCYANVAFHTEDLQICEKIMDKKERDMCYAEVAIRENDLSNCEKPEDQDIKFYCEAVIKEDSKLCEKIIDTRIKDECYTWIG